MAGSNSTGVKVEYELQDELRTFYVEEARKQYRKRLLGMVFTWLLVGSGIAWVCWVAVHP